jgi:hypothetical protein
MIRGAWTLVLVTPDALNSINKPPARAKSWLRQGSIVTLDVRDISANDICNQAHG